MMNIFKSYYIMLSGMRWGMPVELVKYQYIKSTALAV